ncbi:Acetolactate synthase small subunit [Hondaea fermentalgiana]|uniref:Acetolactate synthase small subunit n=1 Tax=Hondaea fermentalgiana TaxID=2315210 RepID=A0A2R5GJM4_9STRA|nr:Acetolactate synthase small subunit [Hondaea fermentalgiana]|eukprot:GBG31080.1 Acetolactate synthase small subunit [Hondaea fermentalgiana]
MSSAASAGGDGSGSSKLQRLDSFVGVSRGSKGGKRTAEDAVNNILYNTPAVKEKVKKHIMSVLVDDSPGVLSKISGLMSARGFNIDSLTVSSTDVQELSRVTIAVKGPDTQIEQAVRQLEDLVDVWAVLDYRNQNIIERELAIVKVSCVPPPASDEGRFPASNAANYDEMMASHFHRQAILDIAKMFEGKIIDIGSECVIVEVVSWSRRVDALFRMLEPYGIIEGARSGIIAMSRSTVAGEEDADDTRSVVDLADLPPS